MKKQMIQPFYLWVFLLLGSVSVTSCGDIGEIHELELERILSPTGLSVRIRNNVNAEVTWNESEHADSYVLEVYLGEIAEGNAVMTIENITGGSYTVSGLLGDTSYLIRVKAIGIDIEDSQWTETVITTDPEQIFTAIANGDLLSSSVTLHWESNENPVTHIEITPGNISYSLTEEDITSQSATIAGLTGETDYTAVIYNENIPRGTLSFTTPRDLGEATLVTTAEELTNALDVAMAGDVLALNPGTYEISTLNVDKDIVLMAVNVTDKPVLLSTVIHISGDAGLSLINIIMDGNNTASQAITYDTGGSYGEIAIDGCEFRNYQDRFFYINTDGSSAQVRAMTVTNSFFRNIVCSGGDFFDLRTGVAPTIIFNSNTVADCAAARAFFRIDNSSGSLPGIAPVIRIENNTLYRVSNTNGSNGRLLYIRFAGNEIHFNNNIVAQTDGRYTNQSSTNIVEMVNNNYFNAPNVLADSRDTGVYYEYDPQFADVENGDFTVGNEELVYLNIGN